MFSKEKNLNDWHLCGFGNAPATLFQSLESTHSLMKARAAAGEILPGTLIVADTQTAGRGRHERTWASPAGLNLYFNILIPLDGIPLVSAPQITQVAALTFAEVFKGLQDDANAQGKGNQSIGKVTVKWPNDILCGKHKFCGILAELVHIPSEQGSPKSCISMGVGINVNSSALDYAHLGRAVTTLKEPRKTFASPYRKSRTRYRTVPRLRNTPLGKRLAKNGPVHRRPRNYRHKCTLHRQQSRKRRRLRQKNRHHL